ncbi:MAG: hypothetical protein ABL927_05415 [Bdellovibrionales bacterium]
MYLIDFFKKVTDYLLSHNIQFALAGGMIASVYRKSPRATANLDILIFTDKNTPTNN